MINQKPMLGQQINFGHPLSRGLVGCWLMNEGGGTVVSELSGNGGGGIITDPVWQSEANGPCLGFSGDSTEYVTIPSGGPRILGSGDFSIIAVVRSDTAINDTSGNRNIVSVGRVGATEWMLDLQSSTGLLRFYSGVGISPQSNTGAIVVGQWHCVVAVRNGASCQLYVDGLPSGSADTSSTGDLSSTKSLYLGRNGDQTGRAWLGLISSVYIYKRSLAVTEIASLYRDPYQMFRKKALDI